LKANASDKGKKSQLIERSIPHIAQRSFFDLIQLLWIRELRTYFQKALLEVLEDRQTLISIRKEKLIL